MHFLTGRQGAIEIVEVSQRHGIDFDAFITWWPGEPAKEDMYELAIEGTTVREKMKEILEMEL